MRLKYVLSLWSTFVNSMNFDNNKFAVFKIDTKQNRSTKGCSKFKVWKHDKFGKDWPQPKNTCNSQMGQDNASEGVCVPRRHTTPVANILWVIRFSK